MKRARRIFSLCVLGLVLAGCAGIEQEARFLTGRGGETVRCEATAATLSFDPGGRIEVRVGAELVASADAAIRSEGDKPKNERRYGTLGLGMGFTVLFSIVLGFGIFFVRDLAFHAVGQLAAPRQILRDLLLGIALPRIEHAVEQPMPEAGGGRRA